jgi:hypothetical protein
VERNNKNGPADCRVVFSGGEIRNVRVFLLLAENIIAPEDEQPMNLFSRGFKKIQEGVAF